MLNEIDSDLTFLSSNREKRKVIKSAEKGFGVLSTSRSSFALFVLENSIN